jgi:hypothetical protein
VKPTLRLLLLALAWSLRPGPAAAQGAGADEPPAAGRPENFSQLVGSYRLSDRLSADTVSVEDPVLLTVRIIGSGPAAYRPERSRLRLFPAGFDRDFYVKPLPEKDRYLGPEKTWEFHYELRPKRLGITKVPTLRLVYYDPTYRRYQTSYAPAVPLTVRPRPQAQPPAEAAREFGGPAALYELVTGPAVLRREGAGWPGLPALIALVLAPPALCALWYVRWRRRHPDAGRLARRRRSGAAEQALGALRALGRDDGGRVADVLAGYLRQRLDLPAAEPTPREAAGHLRRLGVSATLARRTADLFRACDVARFAPAPVDDDDGLAGSAAQLILALEAEPCPRHVW